MVEEVDVSFRSNNSTCKLDLANKYEETNMRKYEKDMINTLATNMRKPTRKARIVARSKILPPIIITLCKDRAVEYFKVNVFVDIYFK